MSERHPPCSPTCYNHVTHPCEKCGRLQGMEINMSEQPVSTIIDYRVKNGPTDAQKAEAKARFLKQQTAQKELLEAARPLMDFLEKNHHSHMTVIVSSHDVELLESQMRVQR